MLFSLFLCLQGALCRRQGHYEQADFIESCATKSAQDPEAINRALTILRQVRIYDETNQGTTRRSQQPVGQDQDRVRRSGSFQKLRQSIRRSSEKLVQKLRGTSSTGWNNQSFNGAHYSPQAPPQQTYQHEQYNAPMKRASSMSVLNNVPLQQQQSNRPLAASYAMEQQQHPANHTPKQQHPSAFRGRLASAENLH